MKRQQIQEGNNDFFTAKLRGIVQMIYSDSPRYPLFRYKELGSNLITSATIVAIAKSLVSAVSEDIAWLGKVIAGLLFVAGWLLAIYLPLLPLIVWLAAVLGWFTTVLHMMIGAPIWALMHANPSRVKAGYFALLRLLIHPAILVIGLVLAMVFLIVADRLAMTLLIAPIVRYLSEGNVIVGAGALIVYAIVAFSLVMGSMRLMVKFIERVFDLVQVPAPAVATANPEKALEVTKRPWR